MRVSFCKSIDVDSSVNITVEDITTALQESFDSAETIGNVRAVGRFLNDVHACLKAVDDSMIAQLNPLQRKAVSVSLMKQAARYWTEERES